MSLLLFGFTCILFTSCSLYYRARLGIKKPKVENFTSVQSSFSEHFHTAPKNLFVAIDSTSFINLFKIVSKQTTQLFNEKGYLVKMQDSGYCIAKAEYFIQNLNSSTHVNLDTLYRITEILKLIKPINNEMQCDFSTYDFIFIGYWSVWLGRGNKNVYNVYLEMSKKNDLKICYIFINFDIMEEWGNISLKLEK